MNRIALTALIVFAELSMAFAASPVVSTYPQVLLSPSSPTMADSVSLWLVLGEASNSCVSTYTPSFSVKQVSNNICVRFPCPQDFAITLTYTVNPPLPLGRRCLMVITQYGPRFGFGRLAVGSYSVYDSNAKDTVASFNVTENPIVALGDSVQVAPTHPTVKDSLTFNLFLADACCCTGFYNQSASVVDSIIYLNYEIDNNPCMLCNCMAAGKTISFTHSPLKAGIYAIYKAPSIYCAPKQPCPYIALLPERVGSVKVSVSTAVEAPRTVRGGAAGKQNKGTDMRRYDIRGCLIGASTLKATRLTVTCPRAAAPFLRVSKE
jgi:hypothetical protein